MPQRKRTGNMKVTSSALLCSLCLWSPSSNTSPSFFGDAFSPSNHGRTANAVKKSSSNTRLFYDIQREPSNENVWNVLATTERWISEMLTSSTETPLSRKEVSYVCEASTDPAMVVSNVFRKLKEARHLGETHGEEQEELNEQETGPRAPSSMRQTQVLVIPSNTDVQDWSSFDSLVTAINQARRSARDYVTDVSLDRLDEEDEDNKEWVVSVNCAHLHPEFGKKTPEQELQELQEQEQEEEIDLNLQDYKEKRLLARRSPFPSIVVEVRAMPPPVFTPPPQQQQPPPEVAEPRAEESLEEEEQEGTMVDPDSDFVQALELLFSKSSLDEEKKSKDGNFYDSIGSHLEEITTVTPLSMAQTWISKNDDLFDIATCAFTTSSTPHVDEAYEFLFTNLAMQSTQFLSGAQAGEAQKRQYLVMPKFCTSSATSMEKFAREADNIIRTMPTLNGKVNIECLHPENIQEDKRCPIPVFVLQWKE